LDPQLAEWADGFIFGEVWGRPGLSHRDRMLVAITALAATGKPNQLRGYLHGALQSGISSEELRDLLIMLVVYTGFPTAIEALVLFEKVREAEERHAATSSRS
jgi:4-carboxymuconolactone decarboxylase